MAEPPPAADGAQRAEEPPKAPRWVKVSIVVGAVVLLLAVLGMLLGGHGPGRHQGADAASSVSAAEGSPGLGDETLGEHRR